MVSLPPTHRDSSLIPRFSKSGPKVLWTLPEPFLLTRPLSVFLLRVVITLSCIVSYTVYASQNNIYILLRATRTSRQRKDNILRNTSYLVLRTRVRFREQQPVGFGALGVLLPLSLSTESAAGIDPPSGCAQFSVVYLCHRQAGTGKRVIENHSDFRYTI